MHTGSLKIVARSQCSFRRRSFHTETNISRNRVFTSGPNGSTFDLPPLWNPASSKEGATILINSNVGALTSQDRQDSQFSAAMAEVPDENSMDK